MKRKVLVLFAILCTIYSNQLFAATDIFVKFSNITGNSQSAGFSGYFEAIGTGSTTVTCATTTPSNPCPVTSKEFVLEMYLNNATPTLHLRQAQGTVIPSIDIVYSTTNGISGAFVYYQVRLENVQIKSIAEVANGSADRPVNQYSLVFERMAWKFTTQNANGSTSATTSCFNFVANSNAGCSTSFPF